MLHRLSQERRQIKMSTFCSLKVCMMLLFILRHHTTYSANAITCDAGTYVVGEPASVSCNLHEDMKECKLNVIIEKFRPNDVTSDPGKELVACHWEETTNDHTCSVENGYRFNDDNGDHPTLEIPSVDNSSAGFYMCYVMPPNETKTHVCRLTPIARPVNPVTLSTVTPISTTPTDEDGETSSTIQVLIVIVVLAGLTIVVLVVCFVYRRRIKRYVCKRRQKNQDMVLASRQPLVPSNPTDVESITQRATAHTDTRSKDIPSNPTPVECITPRAAAHTDTRIDAHLKDLRLDAREYERIMSLLQREMNKRQTEMSSTLVRSLQNEQETGYCLVVVLGSTTLKIVLFNMQGEKVDCSQGQKYKIPTEVRQVTGEQLLKFITKRINDFVDTHNLSGQRMPLGCVVSFPCKHAQDNGHHLTKVQLTKWTKGFGCKDLVGRNMDEILQDALRNNVVNCDLEIKAIINDTVDMLVATAHQDANSKIALVLGDGFNACFVQDENKMYTTTECGSFGDGGCLDLYRTDFDRDLDNTSMNIGEQIMEKMVSMVYLGELVRLVLVKLTQEGLLFKSLARESALYTADSFKTSFVPLVERDPEGNFQNTEFVLRMLAVENFTDEDCATVRYVCRLITERAAHLAATVVAALVKHVEQPEITIAIKKSLYKAYPRFHQLLSDKTIELVGEGFQVNIKPFPNESGRGAALLAAVAT